MDIKRLYSFLFYSNWFLHKIQRLISMFENKTIILQINENK